MLAALFTCGLFEDNSRIREIAADMICSRRLLLFDEMEEDIGGMIKRLLTSTSLSSDKKRTAEDLARLEQETSRRCREKREDTRTLGVGVPPGDNEAASPQESLTEQAAAESDESDSDNGSDSESDRDSDGASDSHSDSDSDATVTAATSVMSAASATLLRATPTAIKAKRTRTLVMVVPQPQRMRERARVTSLECVQRRIPICGEGNSRTLSDE